MNPPAVPAAATDVTLVGRSSSVFTRVARIFAAELGVAHAFRVVPDLLSREPADYGGNPALKLPVLETRQGVWFGALNICRQLQRLSSRSVVIAWPEDFAEPLLGNAQELALQAMATEVTLIMSQLGGSGTRSDAADQSQHQRKLLDSLCGSLDWLDRHVALAQGALPRAASLSYFEVTLFCLVTHLEFRSVVPIVGYQQLREFCRAFGERRSALDTPYRFDT